MGLFPEWTWIVGFFVGAAIGSFLNVVIYRMPRGKSLGNPKHSFCPKCNHQLHTVDLIPLFSWLFTRGRCRYCGAKIGARYFLVEVLTGAIWGGIWYQYFSVENSPAKGIAYALAAAALVAIIFIDWELYVIPEQINGFLVLVGLGYNAFLYIKGDPAATTWGMPSSIAGWIVGVGILWGIGFLGLVLFRKDAMGHADIKMARGIGTILFPISAMLSFALAVACGAVIGSILLILFRNRKPSDEAMKAVEYSEQHKEEQSTVATDEQTQGEAKPETLLSNLLHGLSYLFGIDLILLFFPKTFKKYYGEDPFEAYPDLEEWEPDPTMIPFGPYLALGAIFAAVFSPQLVRFVENYLNSFGGTS